MEKQIIDLQKNTKKAEEFFANMVAFTMGPVELKEMISMGNVKVLDVRHKSDYDISHIPSAISIPKNEIEDRKDELSKDLTYVVYCYNQQCHLGAKACLILASLGFSVTLLEGGFKTWTEDFHFAVSTPAE